MWPDTEDAGEAFARSRPCSYSELEPSLPHSPRHALHLVRQRVREEARNDYPTLDEHLSHMGLGWFHARLFGMLGLLIVADGSELVVLAMLREDLKRDFGTDDYGFALVGSGIFAGMLFGALAGGFLSDIVGRRQTILLTATIISVFGLASALAPDLYSFATCRVITGLGIGAMVPAAESLLLEWSPTQWRSRLVMMLAGIAFHVGAICASSWGILLHKSIGGGPGSIWWRVLLVICTLPATISVPINYFHLPESLHWLIVQDKRRNVQDLLRNAHSINGKEMLQEGQVTTRLYSTQENEAAPFNMQRVGAIFGPDLRYTTMYLIVAYSTCGFVYNGFVFIYPSILQQLYETSAEDSFLRMMESRS